MSWKEKHTDWNLTTNNIFNNDNKYIDNYNYIGNYIVCSVKVIDHQFFFTEFNNSNPILVRNNTYIFDLEHPSNRNHELLISRNPSNGIINNLTINGNPGYPGSFISFYIGDSRPATLYYYCKRHVGMGGEIEILNNQKK